MLFCFCSRHAPRTSLLESHFTRVWQFMSKCFSSTMVLIAGFIWLNAIVCLSSQSIFLGVFCVDFVSSGRNGAERVAKFGINLTKWCMLPINDLSFFNIWGSPIG